jgi:hypothetical protein
MTSFGITPPNLGIAQVSDNMVVEIDLNAALAAPGAGTAMPAPAPAPAADPAATDPAAMDPASGEGEAPAETP